MDTKVLAGLFLKVGARFSKADMEMVQGAHDCLSKLVGGIHCADGPNDKDQQMPPDGNAGQTEEYGDPDLEKIGARHSVADLQKIKEAHDAICSLGCKCQKATKDVKGQV